MAAAEAEVAAAEGRPYELSSPWLFMGTSTSGSDYYLNFTSIREETSGYEPLRYEDGTRDFVKSYKRAWWKIVDPNGSYYQTQTKFYCNKDVTIDIASANYDVNNKYIGKSNITNKLEPIIPGTIFYRISDLVCNIF